MLQQLIAHVIGDYFLQSDHMCTNKSKDGDGFTCFVHSWLYALPFAFIVESMELYFLAMILIAGSHFMIDAYSVTKYINRFKNWLLTPSDYIVKEEVCEHTGLWNSRHDPIKWFIYIVEDNTLHIICNALILYYIARL